MDWCRTAQVLGGTWRTTTHTKDCVFARVGVVVSHWLKVPKNAAPESADCLRLANPFLLW
eukprot:5365969-Alexandrium_andersonii.AAC.1